MGNLSEIVRRRTTPGVLIFDRDDMLLFVNREAIDMIRSLAEPASDEATTGLAIPEEIISVCKILKTSASDGSVPVWPVLGTPCGFVCILRAFFIGATAQSAVDSHIVVLMEKVAERREVDFAEVQRKYDFSRREMEVLRSIARGLSNREIADVMFICEYTVKDHIKRIMRKMGVSSRGKIISGLA